MATKIPSSTSPEIVYLGDMAVREIRAGRQMSAELFFRLGGEPGNGLQNFHREFAITESVANPVGLSRRAGAQLFDYLILADGLHLRLALPQSNVPVRRGHTPGLSLVPRLALTDKDRPEWVESTGYVEVISSFWAASSVLALDALP